MTEAFATAPVDVERPRAEVKLSGSAHESDAEDFDPRGIVFSAVKPG